MTEKATTIESLKESLKQAIEEKRLADQKIDTLKKAIAAFIADLQTMGSSADSATQSAATAQVTSAQKLVPLGEAINTQTIGKVFWSYIVPAAIMFAVIWFVATYFKAPEAKACAISDRIQVRVAARQESRVSAVHAVDVVKAESAAEPTAKVDTAVNPNIQKVHLAIIDLIMDLNTLDRQCASGQDSTLVFEEVMDKWTTLKELIQPEDTPEAAPEKTVPQPEQSAATVTGTAATCVDGTCAPATRAPVVRRGLFRFFK